MFSIKLKLICKQLAAFCCASCWCFRNHHSTLFSAMLPTFIPRMKHQRMQFIIYIYIYMYKYIFYAESTGILCYYIFIFFSHNKFKMHTIYLIIHKGVLLGRRCIFLLWGKYITSVPCGWKLQYVGRSLDRVDFCLVIQVRNNINFHKKENCGCKVYIVKIIIINIINKIQI